MCFTLISTCRGMDMPKKITLRRNKKKKMSLDISYDLISRCSHSPQNFPASGQAKDAIWSSLPCRKEREKKTIPFFFAFFFFFESWNFPPPRCGKGGSACVTISKRKQKAAGCIYVRYQTSHIQLDKIMRRSSVKYFNVDRYWTGPTGGFLHHT